MEDDKSSQIGKKSTFRLLPLHDTNGIGYIEEEKVEVFADSVELNCGENLRRE